MKTILSLLFLLASYAHSAPVKEQFTYTIYIGKPVEEVWMALTTKHKVSLYYRNWIQSIDLKPGGEIVYGSRNGPNYSGKITKMEPPTTLVHTATWSGLEEPDTTVTFEIGRIGKMCSVKITHSGFTDEHSSFNEYAGSWPIVAAALKTFVETGKPLPWPDSRKILDEVTE